MNRLKEVSLKEGVPLGNKQHLLTDWGAGRDSCTLRQETDPDLLYDLTSPRLEGSEVLFSNVVVPPQVKAFVTQDIPL